MPPEGGGVGGPLRVLLAVYGIAATIVALWFGLVGAVLGIWDTVAVAVFYVGAALTSAASAFTAIACAASGDRDWLHRAGGAALVMAVWLVGGGLAVAALD